MDSTLVPTVNFLMNLTRVGHGVHHWPTVGGSIEVSADVLRQALDAAFDPTMANWPAMVEIDDA